jgi:hypothetical protein
VGLQLLTLLQRFRVFAGNQGQTQHYRHGKFRPSVFARHASIHPAQEFESQLEQR